MAPTFGGGANSLVWTQMLADALGKTVAVPAGSEFGARGAAPSAAGAGTTARKTTRKPSKMAGSKVAPKYRNPDNANETWSGRGKQPRWLQAYTSQGRVLDEFLIR